MGHPVQVCFSKIWIPKVPSEPVKVLEGVLEIGEVVLRLRLPHEAPHVRRLHLQDLVGVLSQV